MPKIGDKLDYSVKSKPKEGETLNGDSYLVIETDDFSVFCVIDGLGHGEKAYVVAVDAKKYIEENMSSDLVGLIKGCHQHLQRSRGAVIGILMFNWVENKLSYLGVGNIEIRVKSSSNIHPVSIPGVVGYNIEQLKQYDYPLDTELIFVMYSDGITSKVESLTFSKDNLDSQTQYIIDNLYRPHDDATVLIGAMK